LRLVVENYRAVGRAGWETTVGVWKDCVGEDFKPQSGPNPASSNFRMRYEDIWDFDNLWLFEW